MNDETTLDEALDDLYDEADSGLSKEQDQDTSHESSNEDLSDEDIMLAEVIEAPADEGDADDAETVPEEPESPKPRTAEDIAALKQRAASDIVALRSIPGLEKLTKLRDLECPREYLKYRASGRTPEEAYKLSHFDVAHSASSANAEKAHADGKAHLKSTAGKKSDPIEDGWTRAELDAAREVLPPSVTDAWIKKYYKKRT